MLAMVSILTLAKRLSIFVELFILGNFFDLSVKNFTTVFFGQFQLALVLAVWIVFNNKQWSVDSSSISEDLELSFSDISNQRDLWRDGSASSQLSHGVHQHGWVSMRSNPVSVQKHSGCILMLLRLRVFQTRSDGVRFDGINNVEVVSSLDTSLHVSVNVSRELSKQNSEQVSKKRTSQVQSLLTKVISVIWLFSFQSTKKQSVDNVTKEVSLVGFVTGVLGNVWQEFTLKNVLSVLNTSFSLDTDRVTSSSNVIQGNFLRLNQKSFFNTWLQHFKHLPVVLIVTDVLQNVTILNHTQGSEDNNNWNIGLDVRQSGLD
ncbi:hypothetical protein OGAPHI_001564 [Ogataea philodendri]|uniref:Uncharacterized protein n=1 Tax=Ogataea philodendri TaxID=1378263 RepID=A0A9P8PBX6_9ASCO|nr:uncharacterized protein OGAPHI_001564 [Ogataea philodendri]KAH3669443.1 hypothetical protein OGAPHI_001564 [Ogataea philodendri]